MKRLETQTEVNARTWVNVKVQCEGRCIRCGDCCTVPEGEKFEFPNSSFSNSAEKWNYRHPRDPDRKVSWVCEHLRYYKDLDNIDDLGLRCNIWSTAPKICRDFPTGHENNLFEEWKAGRNLLRFTRLAKCPYQFIQVQ